MVVEAEDARAFLATRFGGCGELVPMGAGEWSKAFAFRVDAERHYASLGLGVPSIKEGLHCCQIHIGLAGQAYMAYAGNWEDLGDTAQRTLDVACRG